MKTWQELPVGTVQLQDPFFAPRVRTNHERTIPSNLEKCHETGRFDAFRLDWKEGMPNKPHFFWDSDVAKVLEGMAYDLQLNPDPERAAELDRYVGLICSAQQPDGYLNVYFTQIEPENRWKCLRNNHELYCAGHLMEAAVAHYRATGKRTFLDCLCRYADYLTTVFGPGADQCHGYPGHPEIELALCKLADASGNEAYRDLARYFVDQRGQEPLYFIEEARRNKRPEDEVDMSLFQADRPVRDQPGASGHAVRALYLYSGMADVAAACDDRELLATCERMWDDIVRHKMYVTGGIGSTSWGERFTFDYDLPNATAYAESCAGISLVLFCHRMLNITGDVRYAETMERGLYNGAISGLSLEGTSFFYANPQVFAENQESGDGQTVRVRQPWFGCSCCPTNYCRFIPQIGSFAYSSEGNTLRVNIPAAAEVHAALGKGPFAVKLEGAYPYDGALTFTVLEAPATPCRLAIRIPGWCPHYEASEPGTLEKGYLVFERCWKPGDVIRLTLDMPVQGLHAHPMLEENAGRMVLRRGPLLYCLEGVDNGPMLSSLVIPEHQDFRTEPVAGLPGVMGLTGKAWRESRVDPDALYAPDTPVREETVFHAVPYALWQNRGTSSMLLWVRYA